MSFSVTFQLSLIDSGVCLPSKKKKECELNKKSKVKPRKIKIERDQIFRLPEKKKSRPK